MGAINNAFNQAGWSILSLASATAKYRAIRNEEGKNRAKLSYNTAATIKKQNDELTKNQVETPSPFFDLFNDNSSLPPEMDEQKITEQKVLDEMSQERAKVVGFGELPTVSAEQNDELTKDQLEPERAKATSFGELPTVSAEQKVLDEMTQAKATSFDELPTVSAENSETNISAKDPEVQGLIEVKQKNALRAVAGQRSQKRYQDIKARLTYRFADEHYIEDVWRNISLDPDVTDEMIRKAGFTKTQILEEWQWFKNSPADWMQRQNIRGGEYGLVGNETDAEDFSNFDFGGLLSAYIKAKAGGKTLKQQEEEYELSKAEEEPEEDNYKVWQDDSTEEEKDETKTDKDSGIIF